MDKLQRFGRYSKKMISKLTKREGEVTADCHFFTHINEEERTIFWSIENISSCPLKTGEYLESPPFSTGFTTEIKWTIRIYPKGRRTPEKVGVFIYKISKKPRTDMKYLLEVKLIPEASEVLKESSEVFSCKNPAKTFVTSDENADVKEWGSDELFPSKYLVQKKSVWVVCYLNVIYFDGGNSEFSGPLISSTLYDDLKEMYKSGKFSDVTLLVKKKHFFVHKAVLAARSKFFSDKFDQDFKDPQTNVIAIEDVDPSVMGHVLHYIYTGRLEDLTLEKAVSLFSVASRYCLVELQNRCVAVMLDKLCAENACQIAVLADAHSVSKLKIATNYIFRKYKHEILQKKEWKEIIRERPQLASDILQAVSCEFNTTL